MMLCLCLGLKSSFTQAWCTGIIQVQRHVCPGIIGACSRRIGIHNLISSVCLKLDRSCSLRQSVQLCRFTNFFSLTTLEMDASSQADVASGLEMTQFSDESNDSTFHFQILQLVEQLYVWIGCNSARMGNLYAALPTRWDKTASVAALVGGGADSTGASMARRLSMRTGWSIILASNIPSNAPVLEAFAEQRLFQELRALGYVKSASKATNGAGAPMEPI